MFKVGDRVKMRDGRKEYVPDGVIGTVVREDLGLLDIRWDGWQPPRDDGLWSVSDDDIELVVPSAIAPSAPSSSAPAKFIVIYDDPHEKTFDTQEAAEEEATALASMDIDSKFFVARVMATVSANAPLVTIERAT